LSDLVVIVYPSEERAEEIRQQLLRLQKEYLIELEDAVVAVKTSDGYVRLNQLISPTTIGAASGSLWGLLIGAIFLTPAMVATAGTAGVVLAPLAGAAFGGATGAIGGALTDLGINDDFIEQLAAKLQPGNAALFLLIRKMTADKVIEALKGTGGVVLRTSLDHTKERALREAVEAAAAATNKPDKNGAPATKTEATPA
jgi:uncharacterized membrane protein